MKINLDKKQKEILHNKKVKGFNTTDLVEEFDRLQGEVDEARASIYDYAKLITSKSDIALELADIVIYALGIAEILGISLQQAIIQKVEINRRRTYNKDENGIWVKDGGSK